MDSCKEENEMPAVGNRGKVYTCSISCCHDDMNGLLKVGDDVRMALEKDGGTFSHFQLFVRN